MRLSSIIECSLTGIVNTMNMGPFKLPIFRGACETKSVNKTEVLRNFPRLDAGCWLPLAQRSYILAIEFCYIYRFR